MLKKIIYYVAILMCFCTVKADALSAKSAVLIDAQAGRVIFDKNAYTRLPMASTTKIMTALIALESGKLEEIVTVSANAANIEGSSIWLSVGEKIKMRDLLYGLMLNSGNDAATAIAEHIADNVEAFANLMNKKVQQMGLKNTSFDNPHGLDSPEHYTTAYDLAQITREALKNPLFAEIVATPKKTIPWEGNEWGRTLVNHNKLLSRYQFADGVKTGFTKKSGRTLVSSATKDNIKLIAVTLNASDDWNDHIYMMDYGFERCKSMQAAVQGNFVKEISVVGGINHTVNTVWSKDVYYTSVNNEKAEITYNIEPILKAPVVENQIVGNATITINGTVIDTADIVTDSSVELMPKDSFMDIISELFLKAVMLLQ